ncbi:MAG: 50S ribosomal protein L18 [Sulfolobales archaeon]|nr:50S ribosomal protein L18 [Sulfolobales archaeon]MCX8208881.1 50S ribosomal protein L18 [Sulfolobales archaeon]MDW8011137.1 50S ribosomal protein L18 [Sulfolobales archaeon]
MARGASYKVPLKRRREGKTNYYRRYRMIKSGQRVRAVVRKTNNYIIVQIVEFAPKGDITRVAAHSKELSKFGWRGDYNNTPAAYLTGLLAGLKAVKLGIVRAIPDIGLHRPVKGCRIFAAIRGLRDAGVNVPVSDEVIPPDSRVRGEHIVKYAESLVAESEDRFKEFFSKYLERGLDPRKLPEHFDEVKASIVKALTGGG